MQKSVVDERFKYKAIASKLENVIHEEHRPGDMLLSEIKLAKQYLVTPTTIRRALGILDQRGLIKRHYGRGTVVVDPNITGEIAIVVKPELLEADSSTIYRKVSTLLSEKIHSNNNSSWSAKLHLGRKTPLGENYPATLDLMKPDILNNIRGVFSFNPLFELCELLRQRRIPHVSLSMEPDNADASVVFNQEEFFRESAHHLREVGCKTVGFFGGWLKQEAANESYKKFLAKYIVGRGLTVQDTWIKNDFPGVPASSVEHQGYEHFVKLWEQGNCPDALMVVDDIIACGVLRAVLHKQIRIPEQIRLITLVNKGVHLPYHHPVTRYEYDMDELADAAFDTMFKLINNQNLDQNSILLDGKLIKGNTT